jgi:hypothetical protein
MSPSVRRAILRANALYIGIAGFAGVIFDLRGAFFGLGPQGRVLALAPHAGIGFVEAHGLAVILAITLWRGPPLRSAHVTALGIETLLGVSNLLFWQTFVAMDAVLLGYVTTILHGSFAALQLLAALSGAHGLALPGRRASGVSDGQRERTRDSKPTFVYPRRVVPDRLRRE